MKTISLGLLLTAMMLTSCSKEETISLSEKEGTAQFQSALDNATTKESITASTEGTVILTANYSRVAINYVGAKTYSYTSSGTYTQKSTGEFIKDSGTIRSAGLTGKGHLFNISFPDTNIKVNTNYTLDLNKGIAILANPTVQDSYVYDLKEGTAVFTTISDDKIIGEITGTFIRFSGGQVSQGKITFEFSK